RKIRDVELIHTRHANLDAVLAGRLNRLQHALYLLLDRISIPAQDFLRDRKIELPGDPGLMSGNIQRPARLRQIANAVNLFLQPGEVLRRNLVDFSLRLRPSELVSGRELDVITLANHL